MALAAPTLQRCVVGGEPGIGTGAIPEGQLVSIARMSMIGLASSPATGGAADVMDPALDSLTNRPPAPSARARTSGPIRVGSDRWLLNESDVDGCSGHKRKVEKSHRAELLHRADAFRILAGSDRTVRNWMRRGELPSYKLGAATDRPGRRRGLPRPPPR